MKFKKRYSFTLLFIFVLLISSCQAQSKKIYELQLNYPDFGEIDFYMTFVSKTDSTFYAYTNPKTVYQTLPFYKKWYLQLFGQGKKPGAVIQVPNGKRNGNNYNGKVVSYIGKFNFQATINDKTIKGKLTQGEGELSFKGQEVFKIKPIINYDNLGRTFQKTISEKIYNPNILKRKDWKKFLKKMEKSFDKADDDLDILLKFYSYKQNLKTSHVYLTKENVMKTMASDHSQNIAFKKVNDNVSVMKVKSFELKDTTEMKKDIKDIKTPNLIIDIRDCPGGDFSSLLLASHFIDKSYRVGYFLGQKYYEKGHNELPSKTYLDKHKPFTKGTLDDFFNIIENKGILVGKVNPSPIHYGGNVYVLTNKNTASAAEPFTYFMKDKNIATIIGENTAGVMLSAKGFNIYKGWWLTLPVANYYTMDNKHLDQVGVAPNIETESDKAMKKAKELIKENN